MEPTQNFGNIYTVFHLKGTDLTSHAHTSYRSACYAATESCAEGVRLPFEVTEVWLVKTPRLGASPASPSKSIIPSKNSPGHSSGRVLQSIHNRVRAFFLRGGWRQVRCSSCPRACG